MTIDQHIGRLLGAAVAALRDSYTGKNVAKDCGQRLVNLVDQMRGNDHYLREDW